MGGRGASSGISDVGNRYGSQYHTVFQSGNIKFVEKNSRQSESLMETMTRGRVYVSVDGGKVNKITFFDSENERNKTIELDHPHNGIKDGHKHHGYFHNEYDTDFGGALLSRTDRQLVDRVTKIWNNRKKKSKRK